MEALHSAHCCRLAASAARGSRPPRGFDEPAHRGHESMFHPCAKAVPTGSYRGQKGNSYTYRVSLQQAQTGQLLQRPDSAGSSLVTVEDRLPCDV